MYRLPALNVETLTDEQRRVHDAIVGGPRGAIGGPFAPWLLSPELADRAQSLGAYCRFGTSLPPRLSELAILLTARHWTAQYEWYAHAPMALEGGLPEPVVEAIRQRRRPAGLQPDEQAVHDFCTEALAQGRVGDAAYGQAVASLGEKAVVELVGILGYYCLVSLTLNIFRIDPPDGSVPLAD